MIDIHSHILFGIDDGPASFEESADLAEMYAKAGFKKVVATPHWVPGTRWMPDINDIRKRVDLLNDFLKEKQVDIKIFPGMEIAIDGDIVKYLDKNKIMPLAGKSYLLVETPFQRLPVGWENFFSNIISIGFKIILAHPERCHQLSDNPELLTNIIKAGIYFQVNYDSFLGYYGKNIEKTAFDLAEKGYIHCLATDSHDAIHRNPENVLRVCDIIRKLIGPENERMLSVENPERILSGMPLKTLVNINNNNSTKKRWHWL